MIRFLGLIVFALSGTAGVALLQQQRTDNDKTATLYVRVIGELAPLPVKNAQIELRGTEGTVVRTVNIDRASDSRQIRGLVEARKGTSVFLGVPYGRYTLKVNAPGLQEIRREIEVSANEHWLTVALPLIPSERTMSRTRLTVRVPSGTPNNPIWARLSGVYNQIIVDARVREDGTAEFRVPPSLYVLIILRDENLCSLQQIWLPEPNPVLIHLPVECR